MNKRFLMFLLALIIVVGGIFWLTRPSKSTAVDSAALSNHTEGKGAKNVTLIEYGDYQCPACGQYYPIVKQVYEKYQADIIFQFRNFPLVQIHQNAYAGSRTAEAAGKQGKYWEMHDILYENQKTWSAAVNPTSYLEGYATQLGLDLKKFRTDYASEAVNNTINADIAAGQKLGANSTPTFVLEGVKLDKNPPDIDSFNKLIEDAIAKKAVKQ